MPPRTKEAHKEGSARYQQAKSKSDQQKIFSEYGVRSSLLSQLPYFDPVRYHVIDPMHNLLGTAKHMMVVWTRFCIITPESFSVIEERVRSIVSPKEVGRLPLKISSDPVFQASLLTSGGNGHLSTPL